MPTIGIAALNPLERGDFFFDRQFLLEQVRLYLAGRSLTELALDLFQAARQRQAADLLHAHLQALLPGRGVGHRDLV